MSAYDRSERAFVLTRTDSRTVYVWVVLAIPLIAAAFSLVHMIRSVFIPYELGYGEGLVLWQSLRIVSPQAVYHPISSAPFLVGMYPPGFLLAAHAVGQAIGDIQIGGRLVTVAATIVCAAMVAAIVLELLPSRFDRRARWIGALTAAALAVSVDTVRIWAPAARVDLLAVALTLSGVFLFLSGRHPGWKWFAAFVCFGLAAFTKQSFVAAPVACFLVAAFQSRRAAIALAATYAALVGTAFGTMQVITDGQFLTHLFVFTQNRFDVLQIFVMGGRNFRMMGPLVIVSCLAAAIAVRRRARGDHQFVFRNSRVGWGIAGLALYVAMAILVSAASGKNGAGPYYFIEWNVACCALVGVLVGFQLARWSSTKALLRVTTALCIGVFGFVAAGFGSNEALRFTAGARALDHHRLSEYQEALQAVRELPGPVLAYDLTLTLKAGKEPSFEPFIMYELTHAGRWNAAPLVDLLSHRKYSAFIGETDLDQDGNMPLAMKNAILSNYPTVRTIGRYRFHLPDSSTGVEHTDSVVRASQVPELR